MNHFVYRFTLFAALVLSAHWGFSQVVIDQTMTPEQLVQEVLLGSGVSVSNITFNGQPGNVMNNQIGRYLGSSNFIDFNDGIILATADAGIATEPFLGGPDNSVGGDLDLYAIANLAGTTFPVNDNAILEFDFVPTGDSLQIRFVFASNEYTTFTCSQYNDPFGFFISGPGLNGPFTNNAENVALIPGTNIPITINSVNQGYPSGTYSAQTCLDANPNYVADTQYYVANDQSDPNDLQFPGMTVTITAYAEVICGETYHIKIGVADVSDSSVDSAVFIEAASFQSNLFIDASLEIPVGVNDSTLFDGCGQAFLTFERPGDSSLVETVYLEYSGDAINGVHYTELPDSIVFDVNQTSITFPLIVPPGADVTGMMQAIVTITNIASQCSGDVLTSEFSFWVSSVEPLEATFEDVDVGDCGEEVTIGPTPSQGYGVYTFDWDNGETTPTITVTPEVTTTYNVIVGDTCGMAPVAGTITINVPVYPDVTVEAGPDVTLNTCLEEAALAGTVAGGNGVYTFEWHNGQDLIGTTQNINYAPPGTSTMYFTGTDACGSSATDSLVISVPPVDIFVDAGPPLVLEHCFDSVQVQATVTGGIAGEIEYNWWSATTGGLGTTTNSIWFNTPIESYVVVEATDICGNTAIDSALVTVSELEVTANAGPDQTIASCLTFVDLLGSATGGYGDYTVTWTQNDTAIWGNDFLLNINPAGTTTYTFTATDECGNIGSDQVTIVEDIPELTYQISPDTIICNGGVAELGVEVQGGVPPYTYSWNSSTSATPDITVQAYETQTYTVAVTDQCGGYFTASTHVIVNYVNAVFDIVYGNFFTVELGNRSTPGDYLWTFGDGNSSTETNPTHSYGDILTYEITLEVTDSLGCQNTFTLEAVPEGEVYIPNAFTPNEDGINDLFEIKGYNIAKFDLLITNRQGEVVFQSAEILNKWDGSVPSGRFYAKDEVYIYSVKVETTRGKTIEKQGTVTVIR